MSVLDDLLAVTDQQQILDSEVLPEFVLRGIKTTDWDVGDVTRADAYLAAKLRQLSKDQIKVLAASRFGDYLFGFTPLPGATAAQQADLLAWAPILAQQCFGVTPIAATYTKRRIKMTNASANAYNKAAGKVIITCIPTGNRYINDEAYVSAGSDAVNVIFRSEFTVDSTHTYGDASGDGITFLTADLPGVTATNPADNYSAVTQVGAGLGTITPSHVPDDTHAIAIRIDTGGHANVGAGGWSYQLDGSGGWTSVGFLNDATNVAGLNVNLTFADGGGYFIAGTIYYFNWPGTDVTQVGRSAETPQELGVRVRAQQPLFAVLRDDSGYPIPLSPTAAGYQALVLQAFPEVKTCSVKASTTINNVVTIYVAGQGALLSASAVAAIGAWLAALGMTSDRISVSSPATQAITLAAGTVKVKSSQLVSAKVEAQRRVTLYLSGADPASPLAHGDLVDRSYIISLIRTTPGVTNVNDALTINGATTDYQLSSATMATYSGDVGSSQTWTPA